MSLIRKAFHRLLYPTDVIAQCVRWYLVGLRVCGVHHRCVCRPDRRLAGISVDGDDVRTGCGGTGTVGLLAIRNHPSQRQRFTIRVTGLHAAVAGGGASGFNGLYKAEVITDRAGKAAQRLSLRRWPGWTGTTIAG